MVKVAIITDIHFGTRGDEEIFLDNHKMFFNAFFYPILREQGIDTIICLGDLFDRRKYINYNTLYRVKEDFITPLVEGGYYFHWILGNHDIYYESDTRVSAASTLFKIFDTSRSVYYDTATEVVIGGEKMLLVPWMNEFNEKESHNLIVASDARTLMGHLEIASFEMHRGHVNQSGESRDKYLKFDRVFTGHFHHKSDAGNIHYLGALGQYNWNDYDDRRGFHIYDTETHGLEYYVNPFRMFEIIRYQDDMIIDFEKYTGMFIKILVQQEYDQSKLNAFTARLYRSQPMSIQTIYDLPRPELPNLVYNKSCIELMDEHVKHSGLSDSDEVEVNKIIHELYNKALEQQRLSVYAED